MKRKYLDDIGFVDRPDTYCKNDKKRMKRWKKQRKKYGFDSREMWNLDVSFYCWLYERLKYFLEYSCYDLSFHKFEFREKTYTQGEMINEIINRIEPYLKGDNSYHNVKSEREALHESALMWAEILPSMWA